MYDNINCSKIIVITGTSKGLGKDFVHEFLAAGYKVVSCGRSEEPDELKHCNHKYLQGDATYENFHHELIDVCTLQFGEPNYYLNNVGISGWKSIIDISEDFIDNMMNTNLKTAFWGCKAAQRSKSMKAILNISSLAGKRGSANNSVYCAGKFAVNGLTQSLAKELGPREIRVNALCPVLIKTPGLLDALSESASPTNGESFKSFFDQFKINNSALNRLPSSTEVASVARFYLSDASTAITGQCMNVDCGVFPQ